MELYLVKEEVKIVKVSEAVSQTKRFNCTLRALELSAYNRNGDYDYCEGSDSGDNEDDSSKSQDQVELERTLFTLHDLPVTISSICSEVSDHSEKFAKRVEWMLINKLKFGHLKLELIITKDPDSPDGYIMLSTKSTDYNVFQRLDEELGYAHVKYNVQISMCHLPTENSSVPPESLISLEVTHEMANYCPVHYRLITEFPIQVPREMMEWWEEGGTTSGFIYCKTRVTITLKANPVNTVYGYLDVNKSLLEDADFKDVEIQCKNRGDIVKCHRALLADKSAVLRGKFKEMLEQRGEQAGPWKLEMKQMSKKGVESFLEYIYCRRVSRGVTSCDAALELLMAAREYQVVELGNAMEEIIMGKGTSDFNYFTVKSALHLFLYARDPRLVDLDLEYLRDKAVRVLQNFLKTKYEKILNSKEYQDLFVKQPHIAMELTSLYMMLS